MLKLILNDETDVELADATSNDLVILCDDRSAFCNIWSRLTNDNLASVCITRDGAQIQAMNGLSLIGVQAVVNPDGSITGHFYYHGEYTEDEYAIAGRILLGEEF